MFSKALEEASPGDKLLLVSYGNGCDALLFEVTPEIDRFNNRRRFSDTLTRRSELDSYIKQITWRGMTPVELGLRSEEEQVTRWSMTWRSRKAILSLQGSRCKKCGTQQYPPQRVCVNPHCGAVDWMEPLNLSEKGGKIVSYTSDMLAATINPRQYTVTWILTGEGGPCLNLQTVPSKICRWAVRWNLPSGLSTMIRSGIQPSTSGRLFRLLGRCPK